MSQLRNLLARWFQDSVGSVSMLPMEIDDTICVVSILGVILVLIVLQLAIL
jgi:hypothetical protein